MVSRVRAVALWCVGVLLVGMSQPVQGQPTGPPCERGERRTAETVVLTGQVRSAGTELPLSGATVEVVGGPSDATNPKGRYRLVVTPDSLRLRVSHLAYETRTRTVWPGCTSTADFTLTPRVIGLEQIQVRSSREEIPARSTRMSTVRLPVEDLETLPAMLGEVDILKTMQLLPGVQSGVEGSSGLYVRGSGPAQNLVLLDGAPVYRASHIFGFLSTFNAAAVDEVELTKGAFPARYGGRLASVVDVTTETGNSRHYGAEGSVGLLASSLSLEGPIVNEKLSVQLSGRRTYLDLLARPFVNRRTPEGQSFTAYFYDANASVGFEPGPSDRLKLSLYRGRDVYGTAFSPASSSETSQGALGSRVSSAWGNTTGSLQWRHLFSSSFFARTTLFASRFRSRIAMGLGGGPATSEGARHTLKYRSGVQDWGGRVDFELRPDSSHLLRFGGQVARHLLTPGVTRLRLGARTDPRIDTTLGTSSLRLTSYEGFLYLEDEWTLSPRLSANLGAHASAMRTSGQTYLSLQPRASARYLLRPDWSVKAAFVASEQYLHLLTGTSVNLPTDVWVSASESVEPARGWQASVGTAFSGDSLEMRLEGYYRQMRNLVDYRPGASLATAMGAWEEEITSGRGRSYGGELLLRKPAGRLTGWIGYTLAWSRRRFEEINEGDPYPFRYDRRHDVSVVARYALTDRIDLSATWVYGTGQAVTLAGGRYLDGRFRPSRLRESSRFPSLLAYGDRGGYRMAPYHRLDLALRWHFEEAFFSSVGSSTLTLGAYNVYNRQNPFYLFPGRTPQGRPTYRRVSLIPVLPAVSYHVEF